MPSISFQKLASIGSFLGKTIYKATIDLDIVPLDLLDVDLYPKFFIRSKNSQKPSLALGCLERFEPSLVLKSLVEIPVNFYGTLHFDQKEDSTWEGFDEPYFFIPRFELAQENKTTTLSAYSYTDYPIELSVIKTTPLQKKNSIVFIKETPSYSYWKSKIEEQKRDISSGKLKKIVLAKKELYHATSPISFKEILENLLQVPNTHAFGYIISKKIGFFGASPETLYSRKNNILITEAIASTRKRGKTEEEDLKLEKELLESDKDLTEFYEVENGIKNTLKSLSNSVSNSPLSIYKNPYIQHLRCLFKAITSLDSYSIIRALHPTPAIGGFPKENAIKKIHSIEPFSRRLYSSVMGIKGHNEEEFIVAIRSFVINGNSLTPFAGVGLVEKSDSEKEWKELSTKIDSILKGANFEVSCGNLCPDDC